ncbi:MAG: roadblock/LC7 domain-containing protein [Candidatus Baldrarchaeia archaeon]
MSSKVVQIKQILQLLEINTPGIEASAIVSLQGLPIVSAMPAGVNDDVVAAMTAAVLSVGEKALQELQKGKLVKILIEGEKGYIIMTTVGQNAILTVLAKQSSNLGLIFLTMKQTAQKIAALLTD